MRFAQQCDGRAGTSNTTAACRPDASIVNRRAARSRPTRATSIEKNSNGETRSSGSSVSRAACASASDTSMPSRISRSSRKASPKRPPHGVSRCHRLQHERDIRVSVQPAQFDQACPSYTRTSIARPVLPLPSLAPPSLNPFPRDPLPAAPEGIKKPGDDLLSRPEWTVPSALEGLTSVFGMGTGGAPPLWSPGARCLNINGP